MTSICKITLSIEPLVKCMGQLQLDTEIKLNCLCNVSYSFFLVQIYYQMPVKGELWNSIVVFLYKLQFSLDNLCLLHEEHIGLT